MDRQLTTKLREWKEKMGYQKALALLQKHGLSRSLAQKLLAFTYPGTPRGLYLTAIEKALKE